MPAPKYFNGSDRKNGKGTWNLNKDYPSVYYKNLEDYEIKLTATVFRELYEDLSRNQNTKFY